MKKLFFTGLLIAATCIVALDAKATPDGYYGPPPGVFGPNRSGGGPGRPQQFNSPEEKLEASRQLAIRMVSSAITNTREPQLYTRFQELLTKLNTSIFRVVRQQCDYLAVSHRGNRLIDFCIATMGDSLNGIAVTVIHEAVHKTRRNIYLAATGKLVTIGRLVVAADAECDAEALTGTVYREARAVMANHAYQEICGNNPQL